MGEEKGKSNPSKSSMPQCLVCPLCVLVIQTSANNFQTILHFTKTEYTLAQVRRLADYAQQQWKPPNPGSPFQLI
jgi:hypothetical protein